MGTELLGMLADTTSLVVFLVGLPAAIWWRSMARYTAVVFHDGERWLNVSGVWSRARGVAGRDLEQFTKQWAGQVLTGKFVTAEQARLPVNPYPRRHHIKWLGRRRGIYFLVGVRIYDPELLQKFAGRVDEPPTRFEEEDEYLPLHNGA